MRKPKIRPRCAERHVVLLDTCILSELRRPQPDQRVRDAVTMFGDDKLCTSVLAIGELEKGISLLPDSAKKRGLTTWLAGLERQFTDRILPVDQETARIWGALSARAQTQGTPLPVVDGLVAATALRHGLHVMTRNTRHFASTGAILIDPWSAS